MNGAFAGLATITPGSGYIEHFYPLAYIPLVSLVCFYSVGIIKKKL